mmetsp:Transcript_87882/g.256891  ORF Transcript_87882/g.256891 Transcript_87882/m.256891 type:complete len:676 (+) Transcript_87882:83-2110(+)
MPSPPTAASLPVQNLLSQLSSEFERLQQQNEDLARENLQLHAAFIGADPACTALSGLYANGDKSKASGLHSKCNCLTPRVFAESLVRDGQMALEAPDGASQIRDVFDELDVHHVGMLYLQDLVHIMRSAGKTIEPDVLVNAVRASNDEEPLRFDARDIRDEFTEAERLMCVDVRAFSRILDGSLQRRLGSGAAACLEGLREACCQRAASSGQPQPGKQQKRLDYCASRLEDDDDPPLKRQRARYEAIPAVVIFLNMVLTGLSIDNPAQEEAWEAAETVFAIWYLLEFVLKLRMLGCRGYFWGPEFMWNWFDIGCLLVSFIDPTVKVLILTVWQDGDRPDLNPLMMIKMFRLARLARLVRILRFKIFYELKIMILGVFSGLRVLTWAIVLLVILTYTVGIVLTNLLGDDEAEFASVTSSMFTLFRCWTEGCAAYDGTPLSERIRKRHGPFFMVFHVLVTMFVTVGVFNLIMAIFIDNVMTSQNIRRHHELGERTGEVEMRFKRMLLSFIKDGDGVALKEAPKRTLLEIASREVSTLSGWHQKKTGRAWRRVNGDWDGLVQRNTTVTQEVFNSWLKDEDFQNLLNDAEIETSNKFELFEVLDVDMSGELSMDELKTGLMKLRGPVTKADIVAVRLKVRNLTRILESLTPAAVEGVATGGKMIIRDHMICTSSELGKD